jgi:hypothetical protein
LLPHSVIYKIRAAGTDEASWTIVAGEWHAAVIGLKEAVGGAAFIPKRKAMILGD